MSNSLFRVINQIFRLLKPIRARFVKLRHASTTLEHHHSYSSSSSSSSNSSIRSMLLYLKRFYHYRNKELIAKLIMFICSFCELFLLIFILLYAFYQSVWLLAFVAAGVLGIFYNNQDLMVFVPNEPPESRYYIELPTVFNLPYEVVDLVTSDQVKLHSYLIKQVDNLALTQPTIVVFHGNAGNIGQRLMIAHYFYTFCGCNVFMVEYRGFGLSEGSPSEKGFYLDGEAAINHLLARQDIDSSKIIPYGQSIGGAVVINLSLKYNEKLLAFIVENTFSSLPDIGRELFQFVPAINYLPDICFKNQFQSKDKIKFITLPGLFINGTSDTMIPPRMTKLLYDRSSCSMKRLLQLEGGDHNNTWLCPGYFQFISKFIQEVHIAKNPQMTKPIGAQVWYINAPR